VSVLQRVTGDCLRAALQPQLAFRLEPAARIVPAFSKPRPRGAARVGIDHPQIDGCDAVYRYVDTAVRTRSPKYASQTNSCVSIDSGFR
jgi:hypothetical protein